MNRYVRGEKTWGDVLRELRPAEKSKPEKPVRPPLVWPERTLADADRDLHARLKRDLELALRPISAVEKKSKAPNFALPPKQLYGGFKK